MTPTPEPHASPTDHADALVFFGATGDLAYKKIFPALQALIQRGHFAVPIIGVAKASWGLPQLVERARASLTEHGGGVDEAAFSKLVAQLRYVDGDYNARATFDALRRELGSAARPLHYLAIPPSLFPVVIGHLDESGCAKDARLVVEKPFGHDLASAQALSATIHTVFEESSVFRIDHYLGKETVQNLVVFRFANTFLGACRGKRRAWGFRGEVLTKKGPENRPKAWRRHVEAGFRVLTPVSALHRESRVRGITPTGS